MLSVPLALSAERVTTGIALDDTRLVKGRANGMLTYDTAAQKLAIDRTQIVFPGLEATLALRGDIGAGAYAIAGPVTASRLAIEGAGDVTANAKILAKFGPSIPWSLRANLAGVLSRIGNATIVNLAGEQVRFKGELGMGAGQPIVLRNTLITSPRLNAKLDSRVVTGGGVTRTVLAGSGRQAQYGPFSFDAEIAGDGPRAVLDRTVAGERLVIRPDEVQARVDGVDYERLLMVPGDGLVTRESQLGRGQFDGVGAGIEAFSAASSFFLCERHDQLSVNPYFQNNLLNFLLAP